MCPENMNNDLREGVRDSNVLIIAGDCGQILATEIADRNWLALTGFGPVAFYKC